MRLSLLVSISITTLLSGCTTSSLDQFSDEKPGFYSFISGNVKSDSLSQDLHSNVYGTPSSCQKTVTALIALKSLGPDYRFQTDLLVSHRKGSIHKARLKFSGDPTLTSKHLEELLSPLKNKSIPGGIILDGSVFQVPNESPHTLIEDKGTSYAPPVSSMNIDSNLIPIKVIPNATKDGAILTQDDGYEITSKITIGSEPTNLSVSWKDKKMHITGILNKDDPGKEIKASDQDHLVYVQKKINAILKKLKISAPIYIQKMKSQADSSYQKINTHTSEPLSQVMIPALKKSVNLVFDVLYLTFSNKESQAPITEWKQGREIYKALIKQHFNINADSCNFLDGSGLSRLNNITPQVLFSLLKAGYSIPEFRALFPKPFEADSTLKTRINLDPNIRAKTGNMQGITCLCGYEVSNPENPQAFVFLGNGFLPPNMNLFPAMDTFISSALLDK